MCLIVFAWQAQPNLPLVLAANRDEFYARPACPAAFWDDAPQVLAGRDLQQGGTWLGVTREGRFAAVTNVREGGRPRTGRRSRGELVSAFLRDSQSPLAYLERIHAQRHDFDGFNLLVGNSDTLLYYSNREPEIIGVEPGVHGLSNASLDTPWPKLEVARGELSRVIAGRQAPTTAELIALLADEAHHPDTLLPDTGVTLEWERVLSAAFIRTTDYGTRCSTGIVATASGELVFEEHSFDRTGATLERRAFTLRLARSLV